jgi:hypothetical protein
MNRETETQRQRQTVKDFVARLLGCLAFVIHSQGSEIMITVVLDPVVDP